MTEPSVVNYLLRGPTLLAPERADETAERMALDLVAMGIPDNDKEAARMLFGHYPYIDVAMLAGKAWYLAKQEIVAREMSKS
jgi:hypothetical protein